MESENQRELYLRFAAWAEQQEANTTDSPTKMAWERIIVGYLELAELADTACYDDSKRQAAAG